MPRSSHSIPVRFVRCLAVNAACVGLFLALVIVGEAFEERSYSPRPAVTTSPAFVLEKYGCWTQSQQAAVDPETLLPVLPSHAVVTTVVGGPARYVGGRVAARAFEQAVAGVDRGVYRVHGFCR